LGIKGHIWALSIDVIKIKQQRITTLRIIK